MAGLAGIAVIGWVVGSRAVLGNMLWVIPALLAGVASFFGLIATTGWSARAALGTCPRPPVGGGAYLALSFLVGGVASHFSGGSRGSVTVPISIAAILGVLLGFVALRRREKQNRIAALRRGQRVAGTVTDDGLAEFAEAPNLKLARITIAFEDRAGIRRWITALATQAPRKPIAVGDTVDVWFDPAAPEDTGRIWVEHDNGSSRIAQVPPA